jgi:hypothetical protein
MPGMRALLATLLLGAACVATAAPVKCVDAKGKVLYIDEADVGALKCEPVTGSTVIVPHDTPSRTPTAAPDRSLEQARERIAAAEAKVAEAKAKLAEQEAIREGNEKNYARVLERLKPYQDAVDQAERELQTAKTQR